MDSRSGIERISVSHHFSGMLRWCTRPQVEQMNSGEFWKRGDGMQALLGSMVHRECGAFSGVNDPPSHCVKSPLSWNSVHLVCTFHPSPTLHILSLTHCSHSCTIICCFINNCFWGSVKGNLSGSSPSGMCFRLEACGRELTDETHVMIDTFLISLWTYSGTTCTFFRWITLSNFGHRSVSSFLGT